MTLASGAPKDNPVVDDPSSGDAVRNKQLSALEDMQRGTQVAMRQAAKEKAEDEQRAAQIRKVDSGDYRTAKQKKHDKQWQHLKDDHDQFEPESTGWGGDVKGKNGGEKGGNDRRPDGRDQQGAQPCGKGGGGGRQDTTTFAATLRFKSLPSRWGQHRANGK